MNHGVAAKRTESARILLVGFSNRHQEIKLSKSKFCSVRGLVAGLSLATSIVGTGTANAAIYTTIWDPLFNTNYSLTLGWAGVGNVSLNASCLAGAAGVYSVAGLGCGVATLTSYKLDFINVYPGAVTATTGLVAFAGNISKIRVDANHHLDGIDLDGVISAGNFNFPGHLGSTDAVLDFVIGSYVGPTLVLQDRSCNSNPNGKVQGLNLCQAYSSYTSGPNAPSPKWELVPEPASVALVGVALAALGLSRRRKA